MPCSDGSQPVHISQNETIISREAEADRHLTARLACEYLTKLDAAGEPIPQWAKVWWNKHQAHDRVRVAEEKRQAELQRLRDSALSKLSAKEKAALGLGFSKPTVD